MTDVRGDLVAGPLDALAERYFEASLALDPVSATYSGIAGHDDRLTDYSPTGHAARAELARSTLSELRGVVAQQSATGPLAPTDAVTAAALEQTLQFAAQIHERDLDLRDLNNVASPVQMLREVFDVTPNDTPEQQANTASRLAAVPTALLGYRESLALALSRGWTPAARQVNAAAEQAAEFGAADGFFAASAAAARGYLELADWLRATLLPGATEVDAVGREVYGVHAEGFLGSKIDLDDTYHWGLAELHRIETRMLEVARAVVPGSGIRSIDEGIAALDADPARSIEGAENFRSWMQDVSDRAFDELAGVHFDIPTELRTLTCRIAPSHSGVVYYTEPAEDFSRPGEMWWSVPAGITRFSTWRETSTVYHEGVPGHHLQIGQTRLRRDLLNRWRRLGLWLSGHGEGWALYAERLMEELGYLHDPGDLMGMLDGQALRACRVVVDIGVHCRLAAPAEVGGGIWDAEKAWEFLSRHTHCSPETRRFELDRYLGWPGQAISYKVGERVWLDLREEVRARQGAAFDLRAFHSAALNIGSVGLDVLRSAVLGSPGLDSPELDATSRPGAG